MKLQKPISRRQALLGAAGAGLLAMSSKTVFDLVSNPEVAKAAPEVKKCFNCCPRNCYDTCSIVSYVEDGVLKHVEGNPHNTYTNGRLCVKGYNYPRRIYSPDRIKYPMKQTEKGSGKWERISWDDAYDMIAKKIIELQKRDGNALGVCLNKYSGNFNVLSYVVEGMMSSFGHTTRCQGTPCWPAGIDSQTFDLGTLYNSDPEAMLKSKLIIVWGANPAWNAVHSMHILAKARKNGTKIVVIDPIMTDTAAKADEYIEIKASTDGAMALGMCKYIYDNKLYDQKWMEEHSLGWQDFLDYLDKCVTVDWAAEKTGVPKDVIERLAKEYATTDPACIWEGFGLQRHTNGGASVRSIDALVAMCGNVGKVGAGANYGQLETWGFTYNVMAPFGTKPRQDNAKADRQLNINNFGAQLLDTKEPKVDLLWMACRNSASQDPEAAVVQKAYKSCDMVVTVDQFHNHSVDLSDIVLPCTTIFETWGLHASYWHYWMNGNEPAVEKQYEAKCDLEIALGLTKRMLELEPGSTTFPQQEQDIKKWCGAEMSPKFKEMFGYKEWDEIFKNGTVKVPLPEAAWSDFQFRTPSKKYEFMSEKCASKGNHILPVYREEMEVPKEFPVRLINPHWKYGLHSQFQNIDWTAEVHNEPTVEMHPELAKSLNIQNGEKVKLANDIGFLELKAELTATVPKDAVVVYEAWYKDNPYNVNFLVKAIPADMGDAATGQKGVSFHDNFVTISKA